MAAPLLITAIATLTVPAASAGQGAAGDSAASGRIDGFRGVPWGGDSTQVVDVMGRPDRVRSIETMDADALVYARDTVGRTVGSLGFLIHPERGLVRVLYPVELGDGRNCLSLYQHLRETVAGMYPEVRYRERMHNSSEDLDFCTAFQLGQAGARAVWHDSVVGARAWVALDLETGVVRVSVEGPGFSVPRRDDGR